MSCIYQNNLETNVDIFSTGKGQLIWKANYGVLNSSKNKQEITVSASSLEKILRIVFFIYFWG